MIKRIIAFILAFVTLFLMACAKDNDKDDATSDADDTAYINITNGELSDYVVIVPIGEADIFSETYTLVQAIQAVSGAELKIYQDTYEEREHEILVGFTSREVDGDYKDSVTTPDDFTITAVGKKILIYGKSVDAIKSAISYFTQTYVNGVTDKIVKIPENMVYTVKSSSKFLVMADSSANDYIIAADASQTKSAKLLQSAIKEATGTTLNINTVIGSQAKEIIITGPSSTESVQLGAVSAFEGKAGVLGEKLILSGGSDEAVTCMVELFSKNIEKYMFGNKIMISENFKNTESFGKELAESVLTSINFKPTGMKNLISKVEEVEVYTPDGSESDWYYSHHPFMTYFNGKYYIFYSSGRRNEDDLGQKVMMATSTDFKNWTLSPLMDTLQGNHSEEVLTAFGLYEYEGKLTVYIYAYEYAENVIGTNADGTPLRPKADGSVTIVKERSRVYYMQTSDGVNWSEPTYMMNWNGGGGNQSPERFGDLLIWVGFGSISYTSDLTGLSGWKDVKLKLDSKTERPNAITESGIYQTSDGTLVLMSRTNDKKMLSAASFDGGKTWTDMYLSDFNDYGAKFQFGTLPDGRYYYVGNISAARAELMLMISEDGVNFNTVYYLGNTEYIQQKDGLYKGGNYGYPTTYIDNEYLHVVYSRGKEALGVLRVKLSDIGVQ